MVNYAVGKTHYVVFFFWQGSWQFQVYRRIGKESQAEALGSFFAVLPEPDQTEGILAITLQNMGISKTEVRKLLAFIILNTPYEIPINDQYKLIIRTAHKEIKNPDLIWQFMMFPMNLVDPDEEQQITGIKLRFPLEVKGRELVFQWLKQYHQLPVQIVDDIIMFIDEHVQATQQFFFALNK